MKSRINIEWRKIPSVTRKGYYFYRGSSEDTTYMLTQSFLTGLWTVEDNHGGAWGSFVTADGAKLAVEQL